MGLYPGDDVRVVGVPVGTIDSIEPPACDVKITMTVSEEVRFRRTPARSSSRRTCCPRGLFSLPRPTRGPVMADGATIGLDRTAVPVNGTRSKTS